VNLIQKEKGQVVSRISKTEKSSFKHRLKLKFNGKCSKLHRTGHKEAGFRKKSRRHRESAHEKTNQICGISLATVE
jgi:hypothetical protein